MSARDNPGNATAHDPEGDEARLPAEILRFTTSERQLHWAVAVPFMVCYATAAVLVAVYNPDPARPLRVVFSWTHRLSGVCLFVLPLWTVLRHRREFNLHVGNVRTAWSWRMEDVKWLSMMAMSTFNRRVVLPDQGKFNAGEKLNFMYLTASYPLFVITGFLIWLPGVAFASWMVHLSLAALATPLILGHVFMATVNPDTRVGLEGMISGYVDRHWAQHHYRHWYNKRFGHLHTAARPNPATVLCEAPRVDGRPAPAGPAVKTIGPTPTATANQKQNKDLSAHAWPPTVMRPSPASQAVPETT